MVKQKTPEELAAELRERQQAGNEFIQQREQLAAQIGGDNKQAVKQAAKQITQQGSQNAPDLQQQATGAAMEAKKQEILTQQGGLEQPQNVELNPIQAGVEKKQMLWGSSIAALDIATRGMGAGNSINKANNIQGKMNDISANAAALPAEEQSNFVNAQRKQLVQEENAKMMLNFQERIGVAIEAIPLLGKKLRKWGLAFSTPSVKVDDNLQIIKDTDPFIDAASNLAMDNPELAFDNLRTIETKISEYESKIQQLMIISPELRANPEEIDHIESEILLRRAKIYEARNRIATSQAQNLNTPVIK